MGSTEKVKPASDSASISAPITVYVVDSDSNVLRGIRSLLRTLNVNISCHQSAEDFLDNADFGRPGCVIAEVHLPGISGLGLQEMLRGRGIEFPVIVIASQADVRMAVRAIALGALDFIEKPLAGRVLLARIKAALRIAATHTTTPPSWISDSDRSI